MSQNPQSFWNLSPSATNQPSAVQSGPETQAPPSTSPAYSSVPGSQPVQPAYQSVAPGSVEMPPQQQSGESVEDWKARAEAYEQQLQAVQGTLQDYDRRFAGVRELAAQMQQQQQRENEQRAFNDEVAKIQETASRMGQLEGMEYMQRETTRLIQNMQSRVDEERQRSQQQIAKERQALATPLYARHLADTLGLGEEGVQRLMSLGDAELMFQQAPIIQREMQRYQHLQAQLDQFSRAQQAQQYGFQSSGMGAGMGSAVPPGTNLENLSGREKATAMYRQILQNRANAGR